MREREQIYKELSKHKSIYIIRNQSAEFTEKAVSTVFESGGKFVEITLNSKSAMDILKRIVPATPPGCYIGAGTVRTVAEVEIVAKIGVTYVVTPVSSRELIKATKDAGLFSVAGAMTPTEVYNAHVWGADVVKVFPAGSPEYIKTLKGPLDDIPMVAVGGVKKSNCIDFIRAGALGVAFGASLFNFRQDGSFDDNEAQNNIVAISRLIETFND